MLDNLSPILKFDCELDQEAGRPSIDLESNISKQLKLMTLLQEDGYDISFDDYNQLTSESISALKKIGGVLLEVPDQKLLLYFKAEKRKQKIARKNTIQNILDNLGYSKDMYEVIALNNSSDWTNKLQPKHESLKKNQILLELGKR